MINYGTRASAGCIRLRVCDAKWIYDNISRGTIVEFYSDLNPGPLGKPVAQVISGNTECRGWDPTDQAEGNPWVSANKVIQQQPDPVQNDDKNVNQTNTVIEPPLNNNVINATPVNNVVINNTVGNQVVNKTVNNTVDNTVQNVLSES